MLYIFRKSSSLFLLGFVIITAYIPGIVGASIPTGWFILIIIAPFCLYELPGLFLIYAALSLLWTVNLNIAAFFLIQFIALACIFQLGGRIDDIKLVFKGLAIGLGISDLVALLFQNYIFSLNGAKAGLFINPNIFCEISVVILIALIVLELYWWIPVTLPGIILVHSRGALLALGVCFSIWLWKRNKLFATILVLSVICIGSVYFKDSSFTSIQERLNLWADAIKAFTLFGNGIGSFEILYPWNATNIDTSLARPRYAHNDLLQLVFELGIGTLLLIPVLWKVITSDNKYNLILYSIGIISLSTYPFHVPVLAFIGCLVAGHISFNNDTVWDNWYIRGSNLFKRTFAKKSFVFTSR